MRSMPLASIAAFLNERKATMPAKLCPARAARKLAGTETRPLRSTLLTNVDRNNATKRSPPPPRPTESSAPDHPGQEPHAPAAALLSMGTDGISWVFMGVNGIQ